jgi:hypothetical protein
MTPAPLRARTIDELHLYLDLAGWEAERTHRLEEGVDGLVAAYRGRTGSGETVEQRFATVPAAPANGPSRLIDAGQWHLLATALASSVPADLARLPAGARAEAARRLARAIAYLDEVLRFLPAAAMRVPAEAFWTDAGRMHYATRPGAFDRDMLMIERRAWAASLPS